MRKAEFWEWFDGYCAPRLHRGRPLVSHLSPPGERIRWRAWTMAPADRFAVYFRPHAAAMFVQPAEHRRMFR